MCGRRDIEQNSTDMLQPGRLQRVVKAPFCRYQRAAPVYFRMFPVFSALKMSYLNLSGKTLKTGGPNLDM